MCHRCWTNVFRIEFTTFHLYWTCFFPDLPNPVDGNTTAGKTMPEIWASLNISFLPANSIPTCLPHLDSHQVLWILLPKHFFPVLSVLYHLYLKSKPLSSLPVSCGSLPQWCPHFHFWPPPTMFSTVQPDWYNQVFFHITLCCKCFKPFHHLPD